MDGYHMIKNAFRVLHHLSPTLFFAAARAANGVQSNFREAKSNEAKLDFLEHRADLNARVLVPPPTPRPASTVVCLHALRQL